MESHRIAAVVAYTVLLAGMSGCAGDSPVVSNPLAAYMPGGADSGPPQSAYSGELANNSQRSIVSPVFGEQSFSEPTRTQRMVSAVTDNPVTNSITGAVKQSKEYLTPSFKSKEPVDPISLAYQSKSPGADLYLRMAERNKAVGNIDQAESMYKKALEEDPESAEALLQYARLQDSQERLGEATELYLQATRRQPENAAAHNDFGLCYARRGMLAESRIALERAVALQPTRVLYRNNLATVLVEIGQNDAAIQNLIAVHGQAVAFHNVGVLLKQSNRTEESRAYFAQALSLDPQLAAAKVQLASLPGAAADQSPEYSQQYDEPVSERYIPGQGAPQQAVPAPAPNYPGQAAPNPTNTPVDLQPYGNNTQPSGNNAGPHVGGQEPANSRIPPLPGAAYPPSPNQFGGYQPGSYPHRLPPARD